MHTNAPSARSTSTPNSPRQDVQPGSSAPAPSADPLEVLSVNLVAPTSPSQAALASSHLVSEIPARTSEVEAKHVSAHPSPSQSSSSTPPSTAADPGVCHRPTPAIEDMPIPPDELLPESSTHQLSSAIRSTTDSPIRPNLCLEHTSGAEAPSENPSGTYELRPRDGDQDNPNQGPGDTLRESFVVSGKLEESVTERAGGGSS